jgi:predicted transposase YbfD/YdcC
MYNSIFDHGEQIGNEALAVDAASFYQAFEQVKDGRKKKGKRYPLALLLTLILLGKMAGETELEGIRDWVHERRKEIKVLLNWPKDFPAHSTYTEALAKCDHHEVAKAFAHVLVKARAIEQCEDEPSRLLAQKEPGSENLIHTAVDGKVMRGTLKHGREDQPPVHLLSFYDCISGIVHDQFPVDKKKNEQSACKAILHPILVKGRIISGDAMFSCRDWCATIHVYGGYYFIPIKDNNPAVLRDITEFFEDEGIDRKEFHYHKEVDEGHGRLEVREVWTSTQMNEWFEKEWVGIAQIFMIKTTVTEKGEKTEKTFYGITSVSRKQANAARILGIKREHWLIENRLHYRRDVTLGEDASQIRSSGVPEAIAALNGGLLALMDFLGVKNVRKKMRHFCAHPRKIVQLLLGKLSRENG